MRAIFVDAVYWVAYANPRDQWWEIASEAFERLEDSVQLVTTHEVLTEFLAALSGNGPYLRSIAVRTVHEILDDTNIEVVPQSPESFTNGLERYANRIDKGYSLQDCISMNVMEAKGISQVLTSDHHFEQEGFVVLMKGDAIGRE